MLQQRPDGDGVAQDEAEAVRLFLLAADQRYAPAETWRCPAAQLPCDEEGDFFQFFFFSI